MGSKISLGDICVDVIRKDIKNIHLSVYPPTGRIRISAPERMDLDTVRIFAISKLDWIKRNQTKMLDQERETPREYLERESHYVWGKRYLMTVEERDEAPSVKLQHKTMILTVRPGADEAKRRAVVDEWYRSQVKQTAPAIIKRWENRLGVAVKRLFVQRMKTRWGSCTPKTQSIRLNTHLAKKPAQCLEYLIVHEMVHLLEPTHNDRFVALMDRFMPLWKDYREQLNRLPVSHEEWRY